MSKLLKECDDPYIDELMDEIDIECDSLCMSGVDLANIKIGQTNNRTKFERDWSEEFTAACNRIKASGRDLSKIPITSK